MQVSQYAGVTWDLTHTPCDIFTAPALGFRRGRFRIKVCPFLSQFLPETSILVQTSLTCQGLPSLKACSSHLTGSLHSTLWKPLGYLSPGDGSNFLEIWHPL